MGLGCLPADSVDFGLGVLVVIMNLFHRVRGLRFYARMFQLAVLGTVSYEAAGQVLPPPTKPMWSAGAFNIRKNLPVEFSLPGFQVQEVVGRGHLLEPGFRLGLARVDVRMIPTRQPLIGALDVADVRSPLHAEDDVEIHSNLDL